MAKYGANPAENTIQNIGRDKRSIWELGPWVKWKVRETPTQYPAGLFWTGHDHVSSKQFNLSHRTRSKAAAT